MIHVYVTVNHFKKDKMNILKLNYTKYRNMSSFLGLIKKKSESYKLGQREYLFISIFHV